MMQQILQGCRSRWQGVLWEPDVLLLYMVGALKP